MALIFANTIQNLMIGRGLRDGFLSASAITIYKGTQPTAAQIIANWAAYNSASTNYMLHYVSTQSTTWTAPSSGPLLQLAKVPPAATVVNGGDASWAILWATNPVTSAMGTTTIPSNNFIVASVSNSTGPGVIRFSSVTMTTGQSVSILDGSIGATKI